MFRKIVSAVIFLFCVCFPFLSLEGAGDEATFGLGITFLPQTGFTTTSGLTRIRVTSALFIDPMISYTSQTTSNGQSSTTTMLRFSAYGGYAFLQHAKTNVCGKGGISFSTVTPEQGTSTTQFGLGIDGEIEQFFTEYFSASLSVPLIAISSISNAGKSKVFSLGNLLVSLGFIWYF